MITNAQISNIVVLTGSIRSDWAIMGIRPVIEELANTGLDVLSITTAAVTAASDPKWEKPGSIIFLAQNAQKQHIGEVLKSAGNEAPCDVCGRNEVGCRKAMKNQIAIANAVHARHPDCHWDMDVVDSTRHEYAPLATKPLPDQRMRIEMIKEAIPKVNTGPELPYVPEDVAEEAALHKCSVCGSTEPHGPHEGEEVA